MLLNQETEVKFNPGLRANQPSNNWAQIGILQEFFVLIFQQAFLSPRPFQTRDTPLSTPRVLGVFVTHEHLTSRTRLAHTDFVTGRLTSEGLFSSDSMQNMKQSGENLDEGL